MTSKTGVTTLYTNDKDRKPLPRVVRYTLWICGGLFFLAFIYSQYISFYFLDRYDRMYAAREHISIYATQEPTAEVVGEIPLWHRVMVLRSVKTGWAELDKPIHGFVLVKELSTFNQMNAERIKRDLAPKRITF